MGLVYESPVGFTESRHHGEDEQQLLVIKKEVSELRSSNLDQENSELLQIKKEEDELGISQNGEQLTVKIVDDERLQLSELHHIQTEVCRETESTNSSLVKQMEAERDGEYCGGTEPNRNPDPAGDGAEWQEARMKQDEKELLVIEVEVPDLWSSSLDQQDTEPLQKTSEEEELWISEEGEHLTVMSEDEEKPQLSEPHHVKAEDSRETEASPISLAEQMETEPDMEDCGGPKPHRNSDPHAYLQSNASDCSETEISGEWWSEVSGDNCDDVLSGSGSKNTGCDEGWQEIRTLQSGVNSSVGDRTAMKPFSCPECHKQFVYQQSFLKHLTCHSGEKSSSCLADLKQSIAKAGKKSVVCVVCGKMFKDRHYLKCHMRLHTGEKPFSCDVCGKTFRHSHILKLHLRIHTGEKPFTCDECGKTFTKLQNLKGHMTCHTGEKPFQCEECGKKFTQRGTLRNHTMIHKGEKPFACSGCDKHFRLKADLQKHMVTHTGVKPFFCRYCGARFAHRGALMRHIRRHTGEKPFACDKCDKRFYRNSELKYHMSVHKREWKQDPENRKFACKECGKKYLRKVHLTAHLSTHSGEKPFSCCVCGMRFTRQDSLKRHTMRVHSH
ncbi:gastrula zinc finger protein XlCGF57.1-like isoform X2 [Girardinichthys multiradiatus]|uniref:gastrula zinc finger protein XlCGF57.1-like isoform X2 n=1 Tax=Girardinichthys multiradiatus TaxID=208333 RepID=UPI001FAD0589|nr:gastrula zinc finger protein XlCGF57.1-like isoform X2 [Girardinichthys multiradiatus]